MVVLGPQDGDQPCGVRSRPDHPDDRSGGAGVADPGLRQTETARTLADYLVGGTTSQPPASLMRYAARSLPPRAGGPSGSPTGGAPPDGLYIGIRPDVGVADADQDGRVGGTGDLTDDMEVAGGEVGRGDQRRYPLARGQICPVGSSGPPQNGHGGRPADTKALQRRANS